MLGDGRVRRPISASSDALKHALSNRPREELRVQAQSRGAGGAQNRPLLGRREETITRGSADVG
jgi:hypothetical protein